MAFQFLDNLPVAEAREQFLTALRTALPEPASELVAVTEADGRITARAVRAHLCVPHYLASAMDGIALRAADTARASATSPAALGPGQYVWVDTGDPIPEGFDAVVMVEELVQQGDCIILHEAAAPWQHIRQIGEDLSAGDMVLPSYTEITPAAQGALLAAGVARVEVVKRPKIGVIPTGDELVEPCSDPKEGEIIEFNSTIFSSMLRRWGCEVQVWPIQKDDPAVITAALREAAATCDGVLLSAGSSAGRDDYSCRCIGEMAEVLCHGVAMKPGKPVILALAGKVPVMGVPGYPVSAVLALEEFFLPAVRWLTGNESIQRQTSQPVTVCRPVTSSLKYEERIRARLGYVEDKLTAVPLARGAGIVSGLVKADCVLTLPQNSEGCEAGERLEARLRCSADDLARTLVITGSHDPLIDEAADLMRQADRSARVASTHVGSTGGLLALKRREAHMGGTHLLNASDGSYNIAALRAMFKPGDVVLVRGVGRTQGLMIPKGNPRGIRGIGDAASGLRYVNRQRGSGTRILFDYLCGRKGLDPALVNGYQREELTHTAVAAQIAAGTADLGMGIWSAAKIYDLDFIPVAVEEYDFAVLASAMELPQVRRFFAVLKSEAFHRRLAEMGGYTWEGAGELIEWQKGSGTVLTEEAFRKTDNLVRNTE